MLAVLAKQHRLTFRTEGKYIIVKRASTSSPARVSPRKLADSIIVSPPQKPARIAPVNEDHLTFPTALPRKTLYSSLTSYQQPAWVTFTSDIVTRKRPLAWFASAGVFANDFTYGGVEFQGGLSRAFIVINAGLLDGVTYRIGYGAGTSLPLHRRWDLQLTYTFARMRGQDNDLSILGHTRNGAIIRDNRVTIALCHQQAKAVFHYRFSSHVALQLGPTFNFVHTRHGQQIITEAGSWKSFFVSSVRTDHRMTTREAAPFQPINKPTPDSTPDRISLSTQISYSTNQFRIGFEVGLSYRIKFSQY